ncbi:polyprenyl synthetase family protein [Candidatus Daviesbacteria bacterium]|nr:polyprenyl synthetase family protein [Candidatus Daviesbacteria bacterium]
MDFEKYLKESVKATDKEIERILNKQLNEAGEIDKKLVPLLFAFIKSCRGGKRIRGALVVLGYQLGMSFWGGAEATTPESRSWMRSPRRPYQDDIYKVAAAYEILHSAVLIHDDIIDQSPLRRDQPALHQALGGNHYALSQAISLADYGFFLSFKLISESDFPTDYKISALKLFSQIMMNTAWGELLDLEDTDPLIVMKFKTACYTIAGPLQLGAILAGANEEKIRIFGQFGEKLGIAYQIRDDILDNETDNIEKLESAGKAAEKYTKQALNLLSDITKDENMSKLLEQMGEYLVKRIK